MLFDRLGGGWEFPANPELFRGRLKSINSAR
jgi:hypothetical protein